MQMNLAGLTLNRAHSLARGMAGWWPLNEGAGRRVNEPTLGLSGLMMNDPVWAGSPLGGGVLFNGSNNYINIPHDPRHQLSTALTLSAWIKPSSGTSYPPILCKTNAANDGFSWEFSSAAETTLYFWRYSGGWGGTGGITLTNGVFQHVAITRDGATETRYVNGVYNSQSADASTIAASTAALQIGGNTSLSRYFGGVICHVRIYNRALSGSEIAGLYINPLAGAMESKLSKYYKFRSPALRWWHGA